jgi:hypothetical protein
VGTYQRPSTVIDIRQVPARRAVAAGAPALAHFIDELIAVGVFVAVRTLSVVGAPVETLPLLGLVVVTPEARHGAVIANEGKTGALVERRAEQRGSKAFDRVTERAFSPIT